MSADRTSNMKIGRVVLTLLMVLYSSQSHPIAWNSHPSCPSFCTCDGEYLEMCVLRSTFEYRLLEKRVVKHLTILECSTVEELSNLNATVFQLLTKCDHSKVEENLAQFRKAFPNVASFLNTDGTTVCSYRLNSDETSSNGQKMCGSNSTDGVSTTFGSFTSTSGESGASMDFLASERERSREITESTGVVASPSIFASLLTKGSTSSDRLLLLVKPTRPEVEASLHDFSSLATPLLSLNLTDVFLLNGLASVSQTPLYPSTEIKHHFPFSQSMYNLTASSNQSWQILATQEILQYRFLAVIISSSLSGLGLLLNLSVLLSLCTHKKISLARVFGMSLMFFNCLLALYGLGMSLCLHFFAGNWELRMCQGLTSLKLFSLGSIAWTLMMMTFRYSIRQSSEDERDAIFKGIVYIFEGMMLVGVFAVLSWVKLNEFQYWCSIIRPETTVEFILVGAEIWHYSSLFLLIVRYPICKILKTKQKVTVEAGKQDNEHTTLVMVIASLLVWVSAYSFTYFANLRIEIKAFVRLNSLVLPVLLQPLLFSSMNTPLCTCNGSEKRRRKKHKLEDKLLSCSCQDGESCSACENRIELLNVRDGKNDRQADALKDHAFVDRQDNTVTPVLVCRSPIIANKHAPIESTLAIAACNLDASISQQLSQTMASQWSASEKRIEVSLHKPGNATGMQDTSTHENNSKYRRQSPVPSFISLEDRTEKGSASSSEDFGRSVLGEAKHFQTNSENEFDQSVTLTSLKGRMSRGPTFYPIKSKAKEELEKKSKSQGSDSIDASINHKPKYEDASGAISENDSLINAPDAESTSKACSKTDDTASLKLQSNCENENDVRTKVSLPHSLEWDQVYSKSHPSNSQRESNDDNTIYSPPYSEALGENELLVRKSSTERQTLPQSLNSSTLYEWEPYGVDEPNSARANEFKGQLEQNEKSSSK